MADLPLPSSGADDGIDAENLALDRDMVENPHVYAARARVARLQRMAADQGAAMERLLEQDEHDILRWPFSTVDRTMGPLRPGTLHLVGARPGCGKTTLMMNAFQSWIDQGRIVVYAGMEMTPEELRLQWAAWACGFTAKLVLNREWSNLPPDARDRLRAHRDWQVTSAATRAIMPTDSRLSMGSLATWVREAVEASADVVVIDHLHRMDWGGGRDKTAIMDEGVREIKELARHYKIPIVAAAQISRGERDVLGNYVPQPAEALKQTGALEEEADTIITLYKALLPGITDGDMRLVRMGQKPLADLRDDRVMAARCVKHRLDGDVVDHDMHLYIHAGRIYGNRLDRDLASGALAARIQTGALPPPPEYSEGKTLAWTLKAIGGEGTG